VIGVAVIFVGVGAAFLPSEVVIVEGVGDVVYVDVVEVVVIFDVVDFDAVAESGAFWDFYEADALAAGGEKAFDVEAVVVAVVVVMV